MTPKQAEIISKMEKEKNSRTEIFRKAYEGKGFKSSIKSKCLDCCCFIVSEIRYCTVETCPLWTVRPYQLDEEESIDNI
jgi:hypothetical protein